MAGKGKSVTVTTTQPVCRLLHKFHREDDEHPFATDVLLVCKGGYIPMHSAILAAGSPILKEHFSQQSKSERESTVVHLQDYNIADITAVATCFYTGSCVFSRKQVRNIYEIFEQLGVSWSEMTLCDAKQEDLKKRSFIRRYLDCVESDDDDMLIEEGERVNLADVPLEALDQLGIPRSGINLPQVPKNTEESPAEIPNGEADLNANTAKKKYPHYVKTKPPLNAAATKVDRDGVTGVKGAEDSGSSSEKAASDSNESDSDEIARPKSAKKRVVKSDEESGDTVSSVGKKVRKRSRRRNSKIGTRSTNKCRKKSEERGSDSSVSEDSVDASDKLETSDEDSVEENDSDDPSNDEISLPSKRETRLRNGTKARILPRRKSRKRRIRSGSEESNEDSSNKLAHSLRKRKKRCVYNEANTSDDVEDEGETSELKRKRSRVKGNSRSSKESEFVPKDDDEQEEEEEEIEDDEEDVEEEDSEEEGSGSSGSSSADQDADDQGQEIDESEKCYLRNLVIRLEKLPAEQVEKYKRKANPQTQRNNPNCNGPASKEVTSISDGEAVSTSNGGTPPRRRSKSPKKQFGASPMEATAGASGRLLSSDRVQPQCGTSENVELNDRIHGGNGQINEPKSKTTSEVGKAQLSSKVKEASTFVLTPSRAAEATRAVVELPDSKNKHISNEVRVFDKRVLRRWYKETRLCQKCGTTHPNHIGASRCLISHKFNRCWICLTLLRSTENYTEHCRREHSQCEGHANCPVCQQVLPWNRISTHIAQVHFTKKVLSELESNVSDVDVVADSDETEGMNRRIAPNDGEDDSNDSTGSPDVNPGFTFENRTGQVSQDSDDECSRPLVTIKSAELLFESDHEDDNEDEFAGLPSLSPQLNTADSHPKAKSPVGVIRGIATVSSVNTSESNNDGTTRTGNMPNHLLWLGKTLRGEEAARSDGLNKMTNRSVGFRNPASTSRPTLSPLTSRHQMPGQVLRGSSVGSVASQTNVLNVNQHQASPSPLHLLPQNIISRRDNAASDRSSTQNRNTLPSNSAQTNHTSEVNHNSPNVPYAPPVKIGVPSRSAVSMGQKEVGSNAFIRNASPHRDTRGNLEAIRNASMVSSQLGVSVTAEGSRNPPHSDGNVNPEEIAHQIRNQLHSRKAVHSTYSNVNPVSVAPVTPRPVASANQPSSLNPNFATLTPVGRPGTPAVHLAGSQNINLATITPVSSVSSSLAHPFRFSQGTRSVLPKNVVTMASSSLATTASGRTLLVSNPSSVSSSSATLLSSRNVVPGPIQGQLRPVINHLPVLNPDTAIVAYNPNTANNSSGNQIRSRPPAYCNQSSDSVAMPPPTGTVVLTSRAVATIPTVSRERRFVGSTVIEGVPFKVFSRPTNIEPHPEAIASVVHDRVFNGRNIQRSPQNPALPGVSYPLSGDNTMFTPGVLAAIGHFQTNMQIGEAVAVNHLHSQANSLINYQHHQVINPQGNYIEPAEMGRHDNLVYRCESCGEEFNMETSLRGHICFGNDEEELD